MKTIGLCAVVFLATSITTSAQDVATCARGTTVKCEDRPGGGKKCICRQLMEPGSNGGYNVRQVEFILPKFGHNCQADVTIENTSSAKHPFVQHHIRFNDPKDENITQVTLLAVQQNQKPRPNDKVYCTLTMYIDQ